LLGVVPFSAESALSFPSAYEAPESITGSPSLSRQQLALMMNHQRQAMCPVPADGLLEASRLSKATSTGLQSSTVAKHDECKKLLNDLEGTW
jgi:hypothetical protein